jgi:RHS repeat-associated protein
MGYHLTTSLDRPSARSHASPKTHTPLPRLQERGLRFHSPKLGRWLSRDPIGEGAEPCLYVMCRNSLVSRIDPMGRTSAWSWTLHSGPFLLPYNNINYIFGVRHYISVHP